MLRPIRLNAARRPALRTFARATAPPAAEKIPSTTIPILRTVAALRRWRRPLLHDHRTVGLVPTMGALHAGHLSLIRHAARSCHDVVVSVYVNPAQFGVSEDLASYPQTLASDLEQIARLDRELADDGRNLGRVSGIFAPSTGEMYPSGFPGQEVDSEGSFVSITPVGAVLEGKSRPTFFRGVATVCLKLFNIVQPEKAYFGQKDVQQTVVVRKMVRDFCVPTEIVVGETVREGDGLAMSSRNVYLGRRRRRVAVVLRRALEGAEGAFLGGELSVERILARARSAVGKTLGDELAKRPQDRALFEEDYLAISDPEDMSAISSINPKKGAILSGAIRMLPVEEPQDGEDLGQKGPDIVRLIDNIILKPFEGR